MKSKKIISALSALVMGATMMAGTAMSASAYCIHDGNGECVEDVQFYAFYDSDNDGTSEWAPAPHGMDTVNIASATNNGGGSYTLTLRTGTLSFNQYFNIQGTITCVSENEYDTDGNMIENNQVTLDAAADDDGPTYWIQVNAPGMIGWYEIQLRSVSCSCDECDCNDYLNN